MIERCEREGGREVRERKRENESRAGVTERERER